MRKFKKERVIRSEDIEHHIGVQDVCLYGLLPERERLIT